MSLNFFSSALNIYIDGNRFGVFPLKQSLQTMWMKFRSQTPLLEHSMGKKGRTYQIPNRFIIRSTTLGLRTGLPSALVTLTRKVHQSDTYYLPPRVWCAPQITAPLLYQQPLSPDTLDPERKGKKYEPWFRDPRLVLSRFKLMPSESYYHKPATNF